MRRRETEAMASTGSGSMAGSWPKLRVKDLRLAQILFCPSPGKHSQKACVLGEGRGDFDESLFRHCCPVGTAIGGVSEREVGRVWGMRQRDQRWL